MKHFFLLAGLLACSLQLPAAPVAVDGYRHVKTVGSIDEYTLQSNGLQVLLQPEHSSPTLTFMVTYRVGSRNEVTGTTGATHILEHLMFKGTSERNRSKGNNVDQLLERTGARYNATTWLDRTNYYQNLGSEHLATVIDMEADRMRHLRLLESDRQPEMTVVRNEYERGENSPFMALYKEIYHSAFVAHPYHHSTIGHRSDIEKVSIEKLREFYDTFYWPNNATVTIVGDFQPAQALALVKQAFGVYPRSPRPIPALYTEEPEQNGPRRVTVKRAGELGVVAIAHKIPQATHPDYAALSLLSAILADGKNSRLYQAITDKNLSTGVSSDVGYNADPSLHLLFLPLAPGILHEEVEKAALQEIERLKKDGVTAAELQAAVAKTLADAAFERDGSFAVAGKLNESIAVGDWSLYYTLEEATRKVTVADIGRVARQYFNEDQSTTGWFVPITAGGTVAAAAPALLAPVIGPNYYRNPELPAQAQAAQPDGAGSIAGSALAPVTRMAPQAKRVNVAGIDLVAYRTGVKDVVTLRGSLPAGNALSQDNPAVATLTAMLLDQGTRQQDKFAIARRLEAVGASIHFHAGTNLLDISAKCLKKDLPLVLGLLAEQLRSPAFSAEEFAKAQKQLAGAVQRQLENTDFRADDAFSRVAFQPGHPNRNPEPQALLAAIASARLQDVIAFHQAHYGPAQMTLVAVGDIDSAALQTRLGEVFAGWQGGSAAVRHVKADKVAAPRQAQVAMSGKTSVSVVLGQASGLQHQHPDYQAVRMATAILGSGFTGRLMAQVRDQEGLTYSIDAGLGDDSFNEGDWKISASFAPAMLDQGIASTRCQLDLWYQQGVTAAEVESRKTNLVGAFQVNLATTDGLANALLVTLQRGYALDWIDDYPAQVRALTVAQVNAAIKKYLQPENMILVTAGTLPEGRK
ncbi:MAG: insulinase family protein [Rhodoferax sp.]|nr:insulinase family protein [Rhodoferax sp.]